MKSYTIAEVQPDGRVYAVIERDDGTTFGQMVDARGIKDDAELDSCVRAAVNTAETVEEITERLLLSDAELRAKIGVRREIQKPN
jgi:hypothetical protein